MIHAGAEPQAEARDHRPGRLARGGGRRRRRGGAVPARHRAAAGAGRAAAEPWVRAARLEGVDREPDAGGNALAVVSIGRRAVRRLRDAGDSAGHDARRQRHAVHAADLRDPTEPRARHPEGAKGFAEYGAYTQEGRARRVVAGDPLQPTDTATTVRVRDGEALVTDGPFAETKERLGGYYLIDVRRPRRRARLGGAGCRTSRYGSVEVRPVMEYAPRAT